MVAANTQPQRHLVSRPRDGCCYPLARAVADGAALLATVARLTSPAACHLEPGYGPGLATFAALTATLRRLTIRWRTRQSGSLW